LCTQVVGEEMMEAEPNIRSGDVERGLRLVPQLGEVMPDEADEEVRAVYEGVRTNLRVPFVNFLFRVLANYPSYLTFAWSRLEPCLLTPRFEEASDALRARALLEPVPETADVDWGSLGDLDRIRGFTDTIHYALPKLLLVVSALDEGLTGEPGTADGPSEAAVGPGVAEGTAMLPMVATGEARGRLREVLEEIKNLHGHPDVASYYRGIANWPRFLEAAWDRVSPLVGEPAYAERKRELLEEARNVALELPLTTAEEARRRGVNEEGIGEIRAVLALFRFRIISDTFLEVPLVKAFLDGPEAARHSRFSFVR
jgi:hypothetical protein